MPHCKTLFSLPLVNLSLAILTLVTFLGATPLEAFGQANEPAHTAPVAATAATVIPALVRYSGVAQRADGKALSGASSITFLIFKDQAGGEPLWAETQTVGFDPAGHYEVYLGAGNTSGLPADLFGTGEARWLEVQVAGEPPQPRVLLVSVPYALKAADAATLGGLPASAFVLAGTNPGLKSETWGTQIAGSAVSPDASSTVTTTGGTKSYIPIFTGTNTIASSEIYDTGTSVGIGVVPNPSARLDVGGGIILRGGMTVSRTGNATSSKAYPSYPFGFYSNVYNSSTKGTDNPHFLLQSEPVGNNTSNTGATFNFLYSNHGSTPAETGLSINSSGVIQFASGQTFAPTSSSGIAVNGTSTSGTGVEGTSSSGNGVVGKTADKNDNTAGVFGVEGAGSGVFYPFNSNFGVWGDSASQVGVLGTSNSGTAVFGLSLSGDAILGDTDSGNAGVHGIFSAPSAGYGGQAGVWGESYSNAGVFGSSVSSAGVDGISGNYAGVYGQSDDPTTEHGSAGLVGVGTTESPGLIARSGQGYGVFVNGGTDSNGDGRFGGVFYGGAGNGTGDGLDVLPGDSGGEAAQFAGSISVEGTVNSAVSQTKIDDPADPANKYLVQSSVQSSERMNIYTGNVVTDDLGLATVTLPDWFESLNADFRYQLTSIGQDAHAWIAQEIKNKQFRIGTNAEHVKVSWQITAVRQDAYAKAHPMVVEEAKPAKERGFYMHPEVYGQPAEKQTEWARHPDVMRRLQAHRAGLDKPKVNVPFRGQTNPTATLLKPRLQAHSNLSPAKDNANAK